MSEHFSDLFELALKARENAYVPYLDFKVGASLRCASGKLYVGCNYQTASLPLGCCAENVAICQMIANADRDIVEVVVVADSDHISPCGACRQQLFEFSTSDTVVHLCNLQGLLTSSTIGELLPLAFKENFME